MNQNEFIVEILARLEKKRSEKQINSDIKQLEKVIRKISLIGTFSEGNTKKELNTYISQLTNQLNYIKLQAKIDNKKLQREINESLKNISFSDIDIHVNENRTKLKVRKAVADAKAVLDKNPLSFNIEIKKEKLNNQLISYLDKNSKIKESSVLIGEVDKLNKMFSNINDKNSLRNATEQFQLFKSEVVATGFAGQSTTDKIKNMVGHITKIGTAFGFASTAINQFSQSQRNLKEIDTILTEISKTSEMTKNQLIELGDASFDTANKYGQLAKNYLLGVQEMARSGYEEKATELGELSLIAQSAGDMTSEMANNYLLATDAAYKYGGSIEKLTSALDGANMISNKNSSSLTDIADATRVSASYAANAGVEIDQLTAAEATMIATTKRSGSEIGRAFRSILLNLQQVAGEFDGEVIDEESLKKVENRCHSLGVELETLKDGVATLRNPMEVLKELSEVYNSLPDSSADKQGLISDIGGKYHANSLTALLSQWDLYEKMLKEFSQGTGSALVEANKTADSWEGKLSQLQNTWDSFVNSITNKEVVKGGISFLDGTIQTFEKLTDIMGTIPTMLTAINGSVSALNKDYGITQLFNQDTRKMDIRGSFMGINFTEIKSQKKHFEEAAAAIKKWNAELTSGQTDLNDFGESIVKNSVQFKSYLATCSKEAPASLAGYKSYLNAAGVSTDTLRLKTVLLTSVMSLGVGLAIQSVVGGIIKLVQANAQLLQSAKELTAEFKNTESSINDYKQKISELHTTINDSSSSIADTTKARQDLMIIQDELIKKFGTEKETVDIITEAINSQSDALDELSKKQYIQWKNDFNNKDFGQTAGDFLTSENIANAFSKLTEFDFSGAWDMLTQPTTDNITTMVDSMKYAYYELEKTGNETLDDLIKKSYGLTETFDGKFILQGNLNNIREDLIGIQEISAGFDVSSRFEAEITRISNAANKTLESYKDAYDTYVLYEKILNDSKDNQYDGQLNAINKAKEAYNKAFSSGDNNLIQTEAENFAATLSDAMNLALENNDVDVADYFRNMYPELREIVSAWEFSADFKLNADGIVGQSTDAATKFGSSEDVLNFNANVATEEQIQAYAVLNNIAERYKTTLTHIVTLLEQEGVIQSENRKKLEDKFGKDIVSSLSDEDLQIAYKVSDGTIQSWDELVAKIEECKASIKEEELFPTLSISDTLSKLNTELKPAFDSLKSAYNDIFTTEDGKKIFTPENMDFSTLDSIKSRLDDMAELGLDVDYSSFENFASVLNNVSSTEKQVDEAFDSLASSIAKAGINGTEDFATLKAALDDLGVVNSEIIAFEALTMNTKALADAGLDLVKATDEELVAFANETVSAEYAEQALSLLQYRKELLSGTALDTTASVQNLINLAEQAKISAEKIGLLQNLLQMISQADLAMQVGNYHIVDSLTPQIEALKKRIQSDTVIGNDSEYAPKSKSAASKSGKKTADAWLEAYKKELAELEHIHDMEEITDREFYENLQALNEKYFNDTAEHHEKYLDEYRSNEEKVAKGLKDVWTKYWEDYKSDLDKVSSYAERVLSRQIDSLKDKQDNEIDGYDGEMDAIEDKIKALEKERKTVERNYQGQIDAIQKQIDAYDDEIDKLKEVSEEKNRQLQLEQDIYELERLRNQKTQKEYVEGRGIVYKVDSGAIRDQEQQVENDRLEIEIAGYEKLIKGLEAQQDSLKAKMDDIVSSIDAQIERLNDQKDGIQDKIDAVNKSYESQIEALEKYKDKWSEVSEHQSMLEEEAIARQLFGVNAETAILEMREGILNDYIGRYQIASDNLAMITDAKLHDISGILAQMQTSADTVSLLSGGLQDSFVTFQTTFSEFNSAANTVDTTNVKENLSTAGTVADSTSGQLENITTKLNELAAEVSSFTLPPLNTEQFTASLGTADSATGILGQLRTFTERFRELCMSIPTVWNGVLSAISGSGLVSGEDRDYNALFAPLLAAMDNCKFQMDTKLAEYVTAWTDFNMDLGAVIGTGGDSGTSSGGDKSVKDARKPKGGNKESGDISTDSIVGTIQSGGDMINAVFDDTWVPGFKTMGEQINEICQKVVECVNEMAMNTVDACRKAVDAINKANAAKKNSSSNNEKPEKFRGNTYTGRAFARGTLPLKQNVDDALVGELGAEIVANTETGAYRIVGRNGAEFTDLNKGDVVISHTQTEQILRNNSLDYLLPQFADVVLSPEFMTQHIKPQFKNPMEDYYDEIQAQMNMQLGAAHESTPTPVVQDINISLPNVKNGNDAQELIKTLERLPLDTIQYIHRH